MSTASSRSRGNRSRVNSVSHDAILRRASSKRSVGKQDAYTFALRVAYLSYLLQPRARRLQHVPAPPKEQRSTNSSMELMKDFSLVRDSKSTKVPHGFMSALDKRITGVLMGKERMPEYNDPLIKRTFAVFLNELKKEQFRKSMEKDRRAEDLLLIFYANATKELQKGKLSDDDSWKDMVDRHVALFIRLVLATLRDNNESSRDRPELVARLQTMEKKLLVHDHDLAANQPRNGGAGGSTVEVEVPRSYEVRDMPLVLAVSRMFNVPYNEVQQDINAHKGVWTEKAALQDLKQYQTNLNLDNGGTLVDDDFEADEAYEAWKKSEAPDISQMMLAIVQSNMELAKSTTTNGLPQYRANGLSSPVTELAYADLARKMSAASSASDLTSSYMIDQSVDMSVYTPEDSPRESTDIDLVYTFIPPEPRMYYRAVLKAALSHDLLDQNLQPSQATSETPAIRLLSKQSTEVLSEMALRWRVPQFSRLVLFLDVVREKYEHSEIDLETLDAAFVYVKEPQTDFRKNNRKSVMVQDSIFDWHKWTLADIALNKNILSSIHDFMLREVFEIMSHCYEDKPPSLGPVMLVLEEHVYSNDMFRRNYEDLDQF
ncbi:hypothetical protein LTS18_010825, partial [Coniosporium uncinatum]